MKFQIGWSVRVVPRRSSVGSDTGGAGNMGKYIIELTGFVAVRLTEGRRWIHSDTFSGCREEVSKKALDTDMKIPHWAKVNPVDQIVKAKLVAVDIETK
jgi:hypothetical protein